MKTISVFAVLVCLFHVLHAQWIPPQPILFNTWYGTGAFASNVTGNQNVAIGPYALNKNTTTHYNTAVGAWALYNATGSANVAVGRRALYSNTTGLSNTAVGTNALANNTYGLSNTALGHGALEYNVSGNWNTAIGVSSGPGYGYDNLIHATALGYAAVNTASFQVRIGHDLINDIGGQVSWSTLSDGRFKRDIQEDIAGLEFINQLRPVSYTLDYAALARTHKTSDSVTLAMPAGRKADVRHTGFVAQEVEAIIKKGNYRFDGIKTPENDKDHYSIRYAEFVVPLVKAVQELTAIMNDQQVEIAALREKIERSEGIDKDDVNSKHGALYQNYPNPFTQDTEIKMMLPETTRFAKIIVYNMEGKELKTIAVEGHGSRAIKFSRTDLAAGMYMYTLIVDGKVVDTKRLVLTN